MENENTTISVRRDTAGKLWGIKLASQAGSLDEVIAELIKQQGDLKEDNNKKDVETSDGSNGGIK